MAPEESSAKNDHGKCDVLIIGAGLIGSSVAMHLAQKGVSNVRVVDFDLEGVLSSSELNAGGVRATWVQPINIITSKISIEYYQSVAETVGYRDCGYLWLHQPEKMELALKARDKQMELGWDVESWDVAELKKRVSFIDKTDDLAGAIFAPKDGLINPNLLKKHFRAEAKKHGVLFDDKVLIRAAEKTASGYQLRGQKFDLLPNLGLREAHLLGKDIPVPEHTVKYQADRVINCAGPWAPQIARILDHPCPSHPVRRQVCIFDSRDVDLTPYGMIVDTTGIYFHPEATNGLAGYADPNEKPGSNFSYDPDHFFMEKIWPALYERSSKFEALKHITGWSGLYEVSPDESAIMGKINDHLFEAHSFSGHGAMHSYAAGLGLAELMVDGRYSTIDFGILSGERFAKNQLVSEQLVI